MICAVVFIIFLFVFIFFLCSSSSFYVFTLYICLFCLTRDAFFVFYFISIIIVVIIPEFVHMHMMPKLITLLTGNQIGAAGATQLADALQRNRTLTALYLNCKHDMICTVVFIIFYLFSSSFYVLLHPSRIIVSHMGCFFAPFQYHCFTCVLLIIIFRDDFADCIEREPNWSCRSDAAGWCASTQQHSHCSLS